MKFFQRIALLCLLIGTFWITPQALAEAAKTLPHYFPEGMVSTTVPHEQFALWLELMTATALCQSPSKETWPSANLRTIKETRTIFGKKVIFNFDLWTREKDGNIYYTDFCGRRKVTEAQFNFAKEDLIAHYVAGVRAAFAYYGNVENDVVKAIAVSEKKSESEVRKELNTLVPELTQLSPPVSFRELRQMPAGPLTLGDFVQTEVHYVHAAYLGMVMLNTEVVYLTTQGRIFDYLIGKPAVVKHELIHGNEKLQDLVFREAFDFELLASPHMMLMTNDQISLMFHGYAEKFREQAKVLFGFDFDQAREEIMKYGDGLNLRINKQKFDENAAKLAAVKKELFDFYHDVVIPEVYRRKIFWASMNNKMGDDRAVFDILAMKRFEPTLLGGHAKTMEWLNAHEEEIRAMGEKAFKASGKEKDGGLVALGNTKALQGLARTLGIDEQTLLKLAKKYRIDPKRFAGASMSEALDIILPALRAEQGQRFGIGKERP